MASQYNDWKRNPTPQALLNPWTKWVKRNVNFPIGSSSSDKPVKKGVRFQREIQQFISSPVPGESTYPTTSTHIRHEPPPPLQQQPPSPEKLLPLLTKDDKYYLIGQKLSSLLNQDQQKRLLRDALDAGKLPPGTNASSNCICPDIMVDIQNMIREEFDNGLAQAQRMVMQPTNNVFVINQGFDKPLPGIPAPDGWSGQNAGRYSSYYSDPYDQDNNDMDTNTEVYYSKGFEAANDVRPSPGSESRQHQKLELTSLRFPKPGIEPFMHCGHCQTDHPTRLFSPAQRRVSPGVRKCIAREGYVRLCAHKVVTWGLVEACLLRALESQEIHDDQHHDAIEEDGRGSFTFSCHHPSHSQAPEVTIYTSFPVHGDDAVFGSHFGRVVLRWLPTRPPCSVPFNLSPDFSIPNRDVFDHLNSHGYHYESLSDLPEDGSSHHKKNVICPGPSLHSFLPSPAETTSDNIPLPSQPDNLHVPALHLSRSHIQASPRSDSRSSFRLSSDISSTLSSSSSYPRSSYSSFNTCIGGGGTSRPGSAMTDHDCICTTQAYSAAAYTPEVATPTTGSNPGMSTPTTTGRMPMPMPMPTTPATRTSTSQQAPRFSEMTIDAVDMETLDIDEILEGHMQQGQQQQVFGEAGNDINPTDPYNTRPASHTTVRINPSTEWYAAVHPDSYSLDKWAKEGLFGLRWCTEPECKSYLALTRGKAGGGSGSENLKGKNIVHRACRFGGSCCV